MKFRLLICASTSENWSEEAQDLYLKKLNFFLPFEVINIKNKKIPRDSKELRIKTDSDQILDHLSPDDDVVLFDERGESFDSRGFSKQVEKMMASGKKQVIFIIGGAYGVDDRVRARARLKVSFSKMVMNHLVAKVVALEQIYRALTILKGLPYHND